MEKFLVKKFSNINKCLSVKEIVACDRDLNLQSVEHLKGKRQYSNKHEDKKRLKSEVFKDVNDNFHNELAESKLEVSPQNELSECKLEVSPHNWRLISMENLNIKYARIFTKKNADYIFQKLEQEVEYFSGDLLKVKVYGKWHNIPRKQVSFGDPGLSYTFSGTCVPAIPWNKYKIIMQLKKIVESVSGHTFNFVLVNRYKDGLDHMGEHRDDEKDLVTTAPIASLSLGQPRDFIFKHKDARGSKCLRKIDPLKLELEHGSLLLMEWPTNQFWYHSLPVRKKASNVRINLTFREMNLPLHS